MARWLERVVVLGAGTMGARLAAHCANHGLEVSLLDVTLARAEAGLQSARQTRPASLFLPELARLVRPGSFDGDLGIVAKADWVVEAIVEDLAAKQELLARVAGQLGPETLLTTNTSGLPIGAVGAGLPASAQRRWLGTHFFNPPRYMRLVEIIPTPLTDPQALARIRSAVEIRLGKGVVLARDTPNFIANRIGVFALLNTLRLMGELGLGVEEVDALTGPLLGWPKSATFRTLDMIGLDTLAQVVRNSQLNLPRDERRTLFQVPPYIEAMLARSWLGDKTGQGFYKRVGEEVWALDVQTLEYHPRRKVAVPFDDLRAAANASPLVHQSLEDLFRYCATRVGEITDDPGAIDQAMRWGYNWQYGPFEMQALLTTGKRPRRQWGLAVRSNAGCSIVDLGEGVGGLEFHSRVNLIGADTVAMITEALQDPSSPFDAWVITNAADNFSAGADLQYLLALIHNDEWDEVEEAVRRFQAMTMAVKRSPRPVVVGPFGLTLGGGSELMLHAARVVAHAELYAGLVEVGVGLIPAGGGTKEMALRIGAKASLEMIAMAKVSTSAPEARQMGLLREGDEIIANRERVTEAGKHAARQLASAGYEAPAPAMLLAPGPSVASTLELGVFLLREAEQISAFDQIIARCLIHVLCAGGAPAGTAVPEAQLLDLEREAFLSLCGEAKTQARIAHMLQTGKALRN
ncbi:MAG TPA: 3-hydroxyacyl-CoA dehydrogenase/enoyl-CoA hydratase family protein [Terriglobales bacterium]|nr:3-hydroxyacyl-CoA dehydrogenase/enoyl-CoA hydratase family protein [Terriglobales bacterium]